MRKPKHYIWSAISEVFGTIFGIAVPVIGGTLGALLALVLIGYLRWWSIPIIAILALIYWIRWEAEIQYRADRSKGRERMNRAYDSLSRAIHPALFNTAEEQVQAKRLLLEEFDRCYQNYIEDFGEDEYSQRYRDAVESALRHINQVIAEREDNQ